jgi:predicted transcriptional regulator
MAPNEKNLLTLTAADLMSASVVMVPEEMSLQGAAHLLAQARVTGAPVVNHLGRCVGVLSATDFVNWVDKCRHGVHSHEQASGYCAAWQMEMVDPGLLPEDAVHNYMTRDPVEVTLNTSIGSLARMMIDAHIHRVIVVDIADRPIGIVSSTDVLAAVARADQARTGATAASGNVREAVAC